MTAGDGFKSKMRQLTYIYQAISIQTLSLREIWEYAFNFGVMASLEYNSSDKKDG